MYHAVEDHLRAPKYKHFYVTKPEFAWQMRRLKQCGYSAITFDTLASAKAGKDTLPARPVLLTFDDGYANLLTNVEPLMRDLGWPYTVFLVSDLIGKTNNWVKAEGYEDTPLLTWDEIHSMAKGGLAQFHAHTKTHPKLADLSIDDVRCELTEAKGTLERNLGRDIDVFCYPYGSYNEAVVDAVRQAGYKMAVTTDFGRVRIVDDPLRLPRISVYHVPPVSLTYGIGTMNFDWRLRTRKDTRPE
jgi:peptidoglycan/xylan/chitin deacetylase (PgdA/CDA1 family)